MKPSTSQWINVAFLVLAIMASGSLIYPDYVPAIVSKYITQTAAFLMALFAGVNIALHRYASADAGPGLKPAAPPALVSLLALFVVLGSLSPGGAEAAGLDFNALAQKLQGVVLDDVQAALADAQATDDDVAAGCYSAFAKLVVAQQSVKTDNLPKAHLILTFQRARDLRRAVRTGSPIQTACAPLALEVSMDFQSLLAALAGGTLSIAKLGAI